MTRLEETEKRGENGMKTVFFTISSGSSGNCAFIGCGGQGVLIDAGAPMRKVAAALESAGFSLSRVSGVFITHEHDDHIKNLRTIANRYKIPVFCNAATARAVASKLPGLETALLRPIGTGRRVSGGDFEVSSFSVSHDAAEPVGYTVKTAGAVISLLTDSGHITPQMQRHIQGSDLVLIESNYDYDMLVGGSYPYFLKQRILSERGHLSNDNCAKAVLGLVKSGVKHIVMGHLSKENNRPERAYETTSLYLKKHGVSERDYTLVTAPRLCPCSVHNL